MNRIKILVFSVFMIVGQVLTAQQRPVQSLYMFDPILINPAVAGNAVQLSTTFINRSQWVNIPGAPVTQTLSVHTGFFKSRVGVGLVFTRDVIGIHSDYGVYGSYSFTLPMPNKAKLALGLVAGFNDLRSDFNLLTLRSQTDPNLTGVLTKLNPNFGTGVYYYTANFFAGASVPYLLENKLTNIESVLSEARQARNYYLHAGFQKKLTDDFKLAPNVLIRVQEGAPLGIDLNANIYYKQLVGIGGSWRSGDAMIFLFQLRLVENLYMGYAYDYITSDLNQFSNGSHEIMLNYRVRIPKFHRHAICPTYF